MKATELGEEDSVIPLSQRQADWIDYCRKRAREARLLGVAGEALALGVGPVTESLFVLCRER